MLKILVCKICNFHFLFKHIYVGSSIEYIVVMSMLCSVYHNQNLHWRLGRLMPSFGSILAVRLKKCIFFRNKTFFFQETFSICLKLYFVKSHRILTYSAYSDNQSFELWGFNEKRFHWASVVRDHYHLKGMKGLADHQKQIQM